MDRKTILIIWVQYSGRILCTFLALLIGVVYLACGFWKMVIFSLLLVAGYSVGQYADRSEEWKETINQLFLKHRVDK